MALTVGTDSYISDADAASYIALMGLDTLDDAEPLLRRATQAVDRLYGARFIGSKADSTQALLWPRIVPDGIDADGNVRDFTSIPVELANATVELALLIQDEANVFAQPEPQVTEQSVKVDVIQKTVKYAGTYAPNALHSVVLVLRPLLASSASMRLVRG
jgi:hypothetical protein